MVDDHVPMIRAAVEDARAEGRREAAEEFASSLYRIAPAKQKEWWQDIVKILPIIAGFISAFYFYFDQQATTGKALEKLAIRLDQDERDTAERRTELIPIIRSNQLAQQQADILNKAQSDRLESFAQRMLQMGEIMERLNKTVADLHEQFQIYRARHGDLKDGALPNESVIGAK